jgi:hypothetical protein
MVAALIVLGGFLSFCAMCAGVAGIVSQLGNPAPKRTDGAWALWFLGGGFVLTAMFIFLGVQHG